MRGLRAGVIAGTATVAAMYLIAPPTGVRPLPDLLQEPVLGLLPGPVFGFLVEGGDRREPVILTRAIKICCILAKPAQGL